jgi:GntR family transcriptional regulator/MocR family aminotransferase
LVRARHRARRNALLGSLVDALPGASVTGVAAGLHVLVTLPDSDVDDAVVADELSDAGVLVHPLSWHRRRPASRAAV